MLVKRLVASSILTFLWLAAGCAERDLGHQSREIASTGTAEYSGE